PSEPDLACCRGRGNLAQFFHGGPRHHPPPRKLHKLSPFSGGARTQCRLAPHRPDAQRAIDELPHLSVLFEERYVDLVLSDLGSDAPTRESADPRAAADMTAALLEGAA